jgi:hypothetical protein
VVLAAQVALAALMIHLHLHLHLHLQKSANFFSALVIQIIHTLVFRMVIILIASFVLYYHYHMNAAQI